LDKSLKNKNKQAFINVISFSRNTYYFYIMPIIDPKLKEKIPALLRNKFFLLILGYFIYWAFFSQNTMYAQFKLAMQLRELEKEEAYYSQEIFKIKKEKEELFSGIGKMEKFAREHYWMKNDSEDLYIFMEEAEKK